MKNKIVNFICETEVLISFFMTLVIVITAYNINVYENLNQYIEAFKNVSIYIASGLLAMIGIILTGIALMLGLLDKDFRKLIKETVGENGVDEIIGHFKFITINVGIASILFFIIYISLFTNIYITKLEFYTISFIVVYYFLFIIFYTIIIISNSIDLFKIKNMQEDLSINTDNEYIYKCANEIKIEYLMINSMKNSNESKIKKLMKKNNHKTYEELVLELNYMVDLKDGISIETKSKVKEYIKHYYNV